MSIHEPGPLSELIRTLRLKSALTQEELAERSGLSVRAISDIERSLRTTPRMETLRMLARALDLDREQRTALFAAARPEIMAGVMAGLEVQSHPGTPDPVFDTRRTALPIPPTRLVGRERELSQLLSLLESQSVRFVTLTGPGGVGKTRLAIAVGERIAPLTSEDLAFVDLTPVTRPAVLAETITESLGLPGALNRPPIDALCHALGDRALLLILDNFEHLLEAAPLVSSLLESCRNLRIVVTSRERLQLRGEHVFSVSPLPLPDMDHLAGATLASIAEFPSVRLFLDRAREAHLDLSVDDSDAPAIAAICRRVDGLPLAIELAASWMRHESATTLLNRLERRLPALTGGARDLLDRQQTLRNTVAWSYDLLPPEQQALFRALCIFPAGFTLEAAVAVAGQQAGTISHPPSPSSSIPGSPLAPFDTVISLMEHSLIQQSASAGQPYRFAILESVREYGLEVLAAEGEMMVAQQYLLSWFVRLTEPPNLEALDGYVGSGTFALPGDEDNLRAALEIALGQGDTISAVRIALSLAPLWWERGLYTEARAALERILAHADGLDHMLQGIVLGWAAEWAWLQSDYLRTRELANAALAICRSVGHEAGTAANLYRLGRVATALDPVAARSFLQEALEINQRQGNDREAAWTLLGIGYAAAMLNDPSAAGESFGRASAMLEHLEDPLRGGLSISCQQARAWIAFMGGQLDRAQSMMEQSLIDCREQAYEFGECNALRLLGRIARERGDLEHSASLHIEALRLSQKQGSLRRECYCLIELAAVALARGQSARAALLLGAEASLRRRLGHVYTPDELTTHTRTKASGLEALGEAAFAQAWQSGEALDWAARLAEASLVETTHTRQLPTTSN